LIRRIPSSVSMTLRRYSGLPVASVKVRASKAIESGATPCSRATSTMRRAISA
jgi:hypothetical protein